MSLIPHLAPPLYRQRTFSEKLGDTTDFVSANWRIMLRYLAMALLPLCLVQALNINQFLSVAMADSTSGFTDSDLVAFALNYFSLIVFGTIGSVVLCSVVYALMRIYHGMSPVEGLSATEDVQASGESQSLNSLTWQQLRPVFKSMLRPSLKSMGALIVVGIIAIVVLVIGIAVGTTMLGPLGDLGGVLFLMFLLAIAAFVLAVYSAIALILPIYAFEHIGFWAGIAKAVRYGFKTLGGCIALLFVVSLLAGVVTGVVGMPFMILSVLKALFIEDSDSFAFAGTPWFAFLQYLVTIIYIFVSYISYSLLFVAIAYQYGHAHEKLDGVGVDEFENASL